MGYFWTLNCFLFLTVLGYRSRLLRAIHGVYAHISHEHWWYPDITAIRHGFDDDKDFGRKENLVPVGFPVHFNLLQLTKSVSEFLSTGDGFI